MSGGGLQLGPGTLDAGAVRRDFPLLGREVYGKPLIYLDNAATTQKPRAVLDAIDRFYCTRNANVHRGVHALTEEATESFEGARATVAQWIGALDPREVVFVRGTTEAINLVAGSFARDRILPGDEILISEMEHHSNIVPWQLLRQATGAVLRVAPIDDRGDLVVEELARLLGPRTRLVSVAHVSNALGTVNPVRRIVELAHDAGARVLLDGAQAAAHLRVDVDALDCDFYAFSGHKMYGPTGIGALYGKAELLEGMAPWQGGGEMIRTVRFDHTTWNDAPWKFEAGTPDVGGAVGLGAAIEYLQSLGLERIASHERDLLAHAVECLGAVSLLRWIGRPRVRAGILSFVLEGVHAHDVGTILDQEGIAIRTGHHCAQPLMDRFGVTATTRISIGLYNTREDVEAVARALEKAKRMLS